MFSAVERETRRAAFGVEDGGGGLNRSAASLRGRGITTLYHAPATKWASMVLREIAVHVLTFYKGAIMLCYISFVRIRI